MHSRPIRAEGLHQPLLLPCLPAVKAVPVAPLRELIMLIPRPLWSEFTQVNVSESLGFCGQHVFGNLHELMFWLGYGQPPHGNRALPFQLYMRPLHRSLFIEDLLSQCVTIPARTQLHQYLPERVWRRFTAAAESRR
ncbi:hypothetical protein IC617_08330 [Neiella sp. HB171785]|uniref:Uncharacterized protein n=1 Tax=Neiella litorisoli TaxID=2771431 RepID=A0A8J6UG07_9GAMM|nr:hypothetical protein [Neiella litorisoli]MBD1389431.1 hypothetical protein [Neiella litorisoli]